MRLPDLGTEPTDVWERHAHRQALKAANRAFVEEYTRSQRRLGRVVAWALFVGFVLALVVSAASAHAQDATESPPPTSADVCPTDGEHAAPRRLQLVQEGEQGVWFRMDVARCLLHDVTELASLRARYSLLEERLTIRDDNVAQLREAVDLGRQAEARSDEVLERAVRDGREGREAAARERDLRWLWFGLGAAVVVVIEIVAILIFAQVSP